MRITEGMIYNNFLSNINKIDEQINNVNNEIATGRKILSPSSDPISLTKALNINSELNMFSSYTKNINTSVSNLNAADSSLQNANNELMNIKNLAIQGANGTNDSDSYNALADNVDQELELLKNIANSSFEGKYIFSGTKSDKPAIAAKNQSAAFVSSTGTLPTNAQVSISKQFADLYQLANGKYTISFNSATSEISLTDSNGNRINIDENGRDTSMTDHNNLVSAVTIDNTKKMTYDTGLGIKLTSSAKPAADFSITFDYKKGGNFLYQGNDTAMQAAIGKGLHLPFTVTGAETFKPIKQSLGSFNQLTDISTGKTATNSTKLTNLRFGNNLIPDPSTISFSGTDHTGINVNSPIPNGLNSNSTVSDLLTAVEKSYGNSVTADFKDGKIVLTDKRGGKSQFEFGFTDASSGTPNQNLFGNFQTDSSGRGYDLFRIGSDLKDALKNNNQLGVVGTASDWTSSSTAAKTMSGIYDGGADDKWTFTSEAGGTIPPTTGTTTIKITDNKNNPVAAIDFTASSTTVKDKDGNILSTTSAAYSSGDILQLPHGVNISFSTGAITSGDSFSVNLANKVQSSIGLIDKYSTQLESSLSKVGSLTNRGEAQKTRMSALTISDKTEKSSLMDADYASVISQNSQLQIVLQATLSSMAQINQLNLFNFIK